MKNILVISGHPDLEKSIANKTILNEMVDAFPKADIRCLDTLYADYNIDVLCEQEALLKADVIILQFPFSWYSVPGLMKVWLDKVFVHGFAHGSTAKLAGKQLILSFTTGAPQQFYTSGGLFGHTMEEYLIQFKTTAMLCNLKLQPPIYSCGISYVHRDEEKVKEQVSFAKAHAARLIECLYKLQ